MKYCEHAGTSAREDQAVDGSDIRNRGRQRPAQAMKTENCSQRNGGSVAKNSVQQNGRNGSTGEELRASISSPLLLRLCCKSLLSISAGNIDSRSGVNTQQRFKRTDVLIRLFQISISQRPLGDFCNTIPPIADMRADIRFATPKGHKRALRERPNVLAVRPAR